MRHPSRATQLAAKKAAALAAARQRTQAAKDAQRAAHLADREDQAVALASSDPLATLQQRRAARGLDASRDRCLALLPLHIAHGYTGGPWATRYAALARPQLPRARRRRVTGLHHLRY